MRKTLSQYPAKLIFRLILDNQSEKNENNEKKYPQGNNLEHKKVKKKATSFFVLYGRPFRFYRHWQYHSRAEGDSFFWKGHVEVKDSLV